MKNIKTTTLAEKTAKHKSELIKGYKSFCDAYESIIEDAKIVVEKTFTETTYIVYFPKIEKSCNETFSRKYLLDVGEEVVESNFLRSVGRNFISEFIKGGSK
ncbi:hypothetical protein [Sphingobacterium chungjuense]|uniref:hypothetical protein n=1 Tax=Sphingobacterium chungjuense TaxID=2675553 RepID=UPI0014094FA0|nr:hypothetical protein [Sphingobacterium chungjuense]